MVINFMFTLLDVIRWATLLTSIAYGYQISNAKDYYSHVVIR